MRVPASGRARGTRNFSKPFLRHKRQRFRACLSLPFETHDIIFQTWTPLPLFLTFLISPTFKAVSQRKIIWSTYLCIGGAQARLRIESLASLPPPAPAPAPASSEKREREGVKSGLPCLPMCIDLPTYLPTFPASLPSCPLSFLPSFLPVCFWCQSSAPCQCMRGWGGWMGRGEREIERERERTANERRDLA